MHLADLQRDPLLACSYAHASKDGRYRITFEKDKYARSWSVRFYRLMRQRKKDAALSGDYDTVKELENYRTTRREAAVTVHYLVKASGIVSAE